MISSLGIVPIRPGRVTGLPLKECAETGFARFQALSSAQQSPTYLKVKPAEEVSHKDWREVADSCIPPLLHRTHDGLGIKIHTTGYETVCAVRVRQEIKTALS